MENWEGGGEGRGGEENWDEGRIGEGRRGYGEWEGGATYLYVE